jgi:hypothetical protein
MWQSNTQFPFNIGQGNPLFLMLSPFSLAKHHQILRVREAILQRDELFVGENDELFLSVFRQDFRLQFQHQ